MHSGAHPYLKKDSNSFNLLFEFLTMIWYEEEVKRTEQEKAKLSYEPTLIFYGSSSIRLWKNLYEDFKEFQPVNLGFGGSTLEACDWFFERIMKPYMPAHIIFYGGDNDLGDGRTAEQVFIFFQHLAARVKRKFPESTFTFISIKPSIARFNMVQKIKFTNTLIEDVIRKALPGFYFINIFDKMLNDNGKPEEAFFDSDGLHLSEKGYALWKEVIQKHIRYNLEESVT